MYYFYSMFKILWTKVNAVTDDNFFSSYNIRVTFWQCSKIADAYLIGIFVLYVYYSHARFFICWFRIHAQLWKKERTKERGSIHKETNLSSVITPLCMNIFRVIQHFLHSSAYIPTGCRFTEGDTLPYEYLKKGAASTPRIHFSFISNK